MGTDIITDRSSNDARAILTHFRTIVRHLRLSSRSCEARSGLSSAQIFVLQKLDKKRALSLNELAEKTLTHQSTVSEVVSRLVEKGFVSRTLSKVDARRLDLVLTSQGIEALRSTPRTAQEELAEAIESMGGTKRKQLGQLLGELCRQAGFSVELPPLFFEDEPSRSGRKKKWQTTK
jgi:DNA-binding MarR family transcriptional regulator